MKIAVIIRNFSISGGGAERYCVELTKKLSKIYEVHVFSQNNTERLTDIYFHQIPTWIKRPRFVNLLLFSFMTKRLTKQEFDIVHSHDTVLHANIYTFHVPCFKSKWTSARGIKKITLWLGTLISIRKFVYLWLERKIMEIPNNRSYISVSDYLSSNIIENYPKLEGKITIAYPGSNINKKTDTNLDYKKKLNIPNNAFAIIFVAHGFRRKGLPVVIKALESLQDPNIHLIVAGRGDSSEIKILSRPVKNNTHFIGPIDDMNSLYYSADLLVHPTLGDTYGMVILEAMANKVPVIVSNEKFCGFSEHLTNNEALLLENPRDSKELESLIMKVYENSDLSKSLCKNAFKKAKEINWDKTLEQTINTYNNYLNK